MHIIGDIIGVAQKRCRRKEDRAEAIAFLALELYMLGAIEGAALAVMHFTEGNWASDEERISALKGLIKKEMRIHEDTAAADFYKRFIEQLPQGEINEFGTPVDTRTKANILARKTLQCLRDEWLRDNKV